MNITVLQEECPVPEGIIFTKTIKTVSREKQDLLHEVLDVIEKHFPSISSEHFKLKFSIDEGLQNAFSHGNRSDPEKEIQVTVFQEKDCWGIIIRDEGEGFDSKNLTDARSKDALMKENGRGLLIMTEYMDEIAYFKGGSILRLMKRK